MVKITIQAIFEDAQKGFFGHKRLVKSMMKVYRSMNTDTFWEGFIGCLKHSLIVYTKEPAVERTIEFAAKFATSVPDKEDKDKEAQEDNEDTGDDEADMNLFLLKFFEFLLANHNANTSSVRYRVCQLTNKLLHSMGDEAQIDDALYDRIYECMLQRLRDKLPIVRVHAVLALGRLQDPTDLDCPIINAYIFLLNCDPNSDVRRAVLKCIAASTKTLPVILERIRDTKDLVRKLAFQVLAEKVHIKALTIAQRVQLLQDGLNDRVDSVREACTGKLLQAWLRTFDRSVVELLQCLDVENCVELSEKMVKMLLKKVPPAELVQGMDMLNDKHVLPVEELTCESVLYWRCLAEYLKSLGPEKDELLEKVVPNVTGMAKYIEEVFDLMKAEEDYEKDLQNEFIMQQLLILTGVLDMTDEVGRKHVDKLLKDLLISEQVGHRLVKPLIQRYAEIHVDDKARINQLVEIISDIREPIMVVEDNVTKEKQRQIDVKIAGIRVKLHQLREDLDEAIQNQDFTMAAEIKVQVTELEKQKEDLISQSSQVLQEVRQEKNDPATLLKCLTIAADMMETTSLKSMIPSLITLVDVLMLPGITYENPSVRNQAVKALGLCCLVSQDLAKNHLLLFVQVSQMDQATVKMTALKVIFDLLHLFGLEVFSVDSVESEAEDSANESEVEMAGSSDSDSDFEIVSASSRRTKKKKQEKTEEDKTEETVNTASSLLNILTKLLDSETSEVRTVTAEGLSKLMLSGRVVSSKLLSRLLLLWYNPITEEDTYLRHCLGTFFPIYAFANRANQEVMEEAFLPTLRTLFNAPSSSPLAEVNVNNVAELMVQLTNARHLVNQVANQLDESVCHDSLAIKVCNEILAAPNSFNVRTLCHILATLELTSTNYICLKDLRILGSQMRKKVKDKQCLKTLVKFKAVVKDMLQSSGMDNTANQTEMPAETTLADQTQLEETTQQSATADKQKTPEEPIIEEENESEKENKPEKENENRMAETVNDDGTESSEREEMDTDNNVEESIAELTDKTNQIQMEDDSQSLSSSQTSHTSDEKPTKRKGKRTKKEAISGDSEPEVATKRSTRAKKSTAAAKDSVKTPKDSVKTPKGSVKKPKDSVKMSKDSVKTPVATKRLAQLQTTSEEEETSGSEIGGLDDEVFASPTPVRRVTRKRAKGSQQHDDSMKKSLSQDLQESPKDAKKPPAARTTRSTRTSSRRK